MQYLTGIFRFLRIILTIPAMVYVAGFVCPKQSEEEFRKTLEAWSAKLLRMMGLRITYKGERPSYAAEGEKGYLVLSNHTSFLDIFALDSLCSSRFVAKAEISRWPVFGFITKNLRTIFIERGHRRAILDIAKKMEDSLLHGNNVLFFPEGTTGPGDRLLPLHPNLIEAAVKTGAPIRPVVLRYKSGGKPTCRMSYAGDTTLFQCLWNVVTTKDAEVEVTALPVISPEGRNRRDICDEVSAKMAETLGFPNPALQKPSEFKIG